MNWRQAARLHTLVDDYDFVLAAPSAPPGALHEATWVRDEGDSLAPAVEHVRNVIDAVRREYPTVEDAYVIGWAQGADVAIAYACSHPETIRAFSAVVPSGVACDRNVAVDAFFELPPSDPVANFENDDLLTAADHWAASQGCGSKTALPDAHVLDGDGPDSRVTESVCSGGRLVSVETYVETQYPHWPTRAAGWAEESISALFRGTFATAEEDVVRPGGVAPREAAAPLPGGAAPRGGFY